MRVTLLKLLSGLKETVPFPAPIYEFGAFRVPGQEHLPFVHDFFPGQRFVGCDMRTGPGVDEIQDLHALTLPDESVGTALLFDTIEHVREPWRAMAELHRCLKPGGLLILTSVWYFPIHAYPDDYWRFTASAFRSLMGDAFHPIAVDMCGLARLPHTVFGIASKGPVDPAVERAIQEAVAAWKRRGAHSWKETVMEVTPPFVLIPAYDLFLRAMRLLHPKRRAQAAARALEEGARPVGGPPELEKGQSG
jgi:SAM-dependent methyltransferase